uniref:(California timema) hypothetical protein n=1 Tax=Timema californicum TaxID=61474 RepID=A0A7R9P3Y2_TIMCA|nr:unnamed protein product [Timema californicum]
MRFGAGAVSFGNKYWSMGGGIPDATVVTRGVAAPGECVRGRIEWSLSWLQSFGDLGKDFSGKEINMEASEFNKAVAEQRRFYQKCCPKVCVKKKDQQSIFWITSEKALEAMLSIMPSSLISTLVLIVSLNCMRHPLQILGVGNSSHDVSATTTCRPMRKGGVSSLGDCLTSSASTNLPSSTPPTTTHLDAAATDPTPGSPAYPPPESPEYPPQESSAYQTSEYSQPESPTFPPLTK